MNPLNPTFYAHPTAVIDENCSIGKGTKIWHFCHVMTGAIIGKNCSLGQNVMVASGVELGDRCKVQNNVSLYTGVICEEDVFLGPSMVFTNVKNPRSAIVRRDSYTQTYLRKGATIGANATLICGMEIGSYAFVGAGAVVTQSVPPYALVVGNPARQIGWMSEWGHRLNFDQNGEATCPESKEKYTLSASGVQKTSYLGNP
jgi:UDP-2-acetamido-3-amino-2,3-dideoxy-glucuronate N-acetyltransferase